MEGLKDLSVKLIELKEKVYDINQEIRAVEEQIIELMGANDEGTRTIQMDGMSLSTVGKINRTIDNNKLREIWNELPEFVRKEVFKMKPTIDMKNYRALRDMDEGLWYKVSGAIVSKPGKTTVAIKIFGDDDGK